MSDHSLIDPYVRGELSASEASAFESELKNDPLLQQEYEFRKNLIAVTEAEDSKAFRNQLERYEQASSFNPRKLLKFGVAAVFVLGLTYIIGFHKTAEEKLFAKNFEAYRNVVQPVVRGEESENDLYLAFSNYENADYNEAIKRFNSTLESSQDAPIYFYLGISYLATDDTEEAITNFNNYLNTKDTRFKEQTHWYEALAYLRAGNKEMAQTLFENIVALQQYNHTQAAAILEFLK